MTRKEFIFNLIDKYLKPLLHLIVLTFIIIYFFNIANNNTSNNVNIIFNLILLICIIFLILGVIKYVVDIISYNLSHSIKKFLVKLTTFINILSYIGLFIVAYFSYIEGEIFQTILIISTIIYLTYKKTKQT